MSTTADSLAPGGAAIDKDGRIDLVGLSRAEMETVFAGMGLPKFRVKQVWHWIYHHGVRDFSEMTTIAKGLQPELA
ncbi:MAG: 23S rRNA (adenine(2503)-C(2))-methyltransferase RlmN, partial [Alphaproteobacteria bacterium]|nr:23S rRNA (adenine(2503)-C(2))-methyltransferase RlmN [Alphaproteobacteria bacterium]